MGESPLTVCRFLSALSRQQDYGTYLEVERQVVRRRNKDERVQELGNQRCVVGHRVEDLQRQDWILGPSGLPYSKQDPAHDAENDQAQDFG